MTARITLGILLTALTAGAESPAVLALEVRSECALSVVSQAPTADGFLTITFNYRLRTSSPQGRGQITLITPATADIPFQTRLQGPGTPISGTASAATASGPGIVIAQFGAEANSLRNGATGSVQLPVSTGPATLSISCQ